MGKLLIISPTQTHPSNAGNRVRILNFVERLRQMFHVEIWFLYIDLDGTVTEETLSYWGNNIVVYHSEKDMSTPKKRTLIDRVLLKLRLMNYEQWDYNFHIDDCFDDQILNLCKEMHLRHNFAAVLVEYVFMSKAFTVFSSKVKKIIDTHDCFTDRYKIYPVVNGKRPYRWFSTHLYDEKKALNRADAVISIQEEEARFFRSITPREVLTVGHLFHDASLSEQPHYCGERILIFASDNVINVDAYHFFTTEVWPRVLLRLPACQLVVAGKICRVIQSTDNSVILFGEVAETSDAYRGVSLSVNPMQYGSGLKIKTLESLTMGVPVVSTAHGAIGLEQMIDKAVFVAVNPEDFSQKIVHLLTNNTSYAQAEVDLRKCLKVYQNQNTEAIKKLFGNALKE